MNAPRHIPITEAQFNMEEIESSVTGAGILPVAYNDDGDMMLMLGKERYVNHWRGSLKWSGFEGGRKHGESVEYTAAREFIEESLGTIPIPTNAQNSINDISEIANMLANGEYVARIILCIIQPDAVPRRYHVTYLVNIPFNRQYVTLFRERRQAFVDLIGKTEQLNRVKESLSDNLPRENAPFRGHQVTVITDAHISERSTLCIEFVDDKTDKHTFEISDSHAEIMFAYCRWFHLRRMCTKDSKDLCLHHSAFRDIQRNSAGAVVVAKMNEDFVEKQSIDWWSLEDLRKVLQNGGYMHNDYFRAYFLPVLQRTIEELDLTQNICRPCHT